jgi:protein N-terminal glutamine amidohydrolase
MEKQTVKYTKNYCEENVWHLCRHPEIKSLENKVLIISNESKNCPFWNHNSTDNRSPVWWDYHVVLLVLEQGNWMVYDFDSTLGFPVDLGTYLQQTFGEITSLNAENRPFFKIFSGYIFTDTFYSDRSHMKDGEGNWIFMPPSWPIVEHGNTQKLEMDEIMNFSPSSAQKITSIDELKAAYL